MNPLDSRRMSWTHNLALSVVLILPSHALGDDVGQAVPASVVDLGDDVDTVRFTFQNAPWPDVLAEFAQWADLTLDMTDTPPGDFSYFDNRSRTPTQAIDVLNGYLLPRGHVLLRRDRFLVCLKTDSPMLPSLIPTVAIERLGDLGDNELVNVLVPLDEISAESAAEEIRGVLGPFGLATPLESSRSILLRGFGRGLRQSLDILRISRPPITDEKLDFRSYAIEHLPVQDVERQIRNLFGVTGPETARNVSGARSDMDRSQYYRDRGRRDDDRDREGRSSPPIPLLQQVAMNMQLSSLDTTNTLLVTATPEGLNLIEGVLKSIDVPSGLSASERIRSAEPDLRVYGMVSADEGEVAKTIDVLMPGVIVNEDSRQDTIHVFANEEQHREVERLIRILDVNEGGIREVAVIPLRRSNPSAVASFLNQLFSNDDRDERPMVQAELATRSIIVRGTSNQVAQVRDALMKFGESATAPTSNKRAISVRRIQIGNDNAKRVADSAADLFSRGDSAGLDIRVVVPGGRDAVEPQRNVPIPSGETIEANRHDDSDNGQASSNKKLTAWTSIVAGSLDDADSRQEDRLVRMIQSRTALDAAESQVAQPRTRVDIELDGDGLIVSSSDPEALRAVEETIRELARQLPGRKSWSVFYLRVAEAQKAAGQLFQLVDDSTYAGDGVILTDQNVQPLRIIPDVRTNALFVSGSADQVARAGQFLEYIDATEVPGSFIDRKPHSIRVQHADVEEVANLLRVLYKDYLVDPVAERAQVQRRRSGDDEERNRDSRDNPRGGDPATESPGIRLTLATDTKTGEILVACNDQLFQEIQEVVAERDRAAEDSRTTVQVIPIAEGLEQDVLRALQVLSPRVQISEETIGQLETRNSRDGRTSRDDRSDRRRRDE